MRAPIWSTATTTPRASLTEEVEADVCVVGGGLAGLLTALLLARAGVRVSLLEARRLGQGTTGRSTAKVTLLQGIHASEIAAMHGNGLAARYLEANGEGLAWLRRFCGEHGVGWEAMPAYTCATTLEGEMKARAEERVLRASGIEATWEIDTGLPLQHRGGVRVPDQGQVDPAELVAGLAREAEAAGAVIHEQSRALGVHHSGSRVRVTTSGGAVTAGRVVIATNAPVHDVTGFFGRQEATRSHAAAFHSDWEPAGMYLTVDAEPRSVRGARHDGERVVIVAGGPHLTGATRPSAELEKLVRAARALPVGAEVATWSAQDQSPAGHLPYAGPLTPGNDRVLVVTGFEKWGFANAVAAALLLSKRLLGSAPPAWGTAFATWSVREVQAIQPLLRHNTRVGCRLATGHVARLAAGEHKPPLCTHLGGVLVFNDIEETWDCPLHGSRFEPDGAVLDAPAVRPLSS